MEIPGAAALWTVGSFLLGQGVVFGGVLINNASQARRERAAREAERQRLRADRREAFELAHLQDLHAELTELMLVAETCVLQWITWYEGLHEPRLRRDPESRAGLETSATALQRTTEQHLEKINRLSGLVIPDHLRLRLDGAHGQYAFVLENVHDREPGETRRGLSLALSALKVAQAAVAARIREIYVGADSLSGATAESR
ncbi:hypothetical protein ABZS96_34275 [Streptomyces avermitilis]|uniref:hypothetical protein n=1 Tax=Streptomyces avermitilis TaxID=33903 RepID=UPI0033BAFBB4